MKLAACFRRFPSASLVVAWHRGADAAPLGDTAPSAARNELFAGVRR